MRKDKPSVKFKITGLGAAACVWALRSMDPPKGRVNVRKHANCSLGFENGCLKKKENKQGINEMVWDDGNVQFKNLEIAEFLYNTICKKIEAGIPTNYTIGIQESLEILEPIIKGEGKEG